MAGGALAPNQGLKLTMTADKVRDLRLDRVGKQATRATVQEFGELIAESAWLNQFDDVRIRTTYYSSGFLTYIVTAFRP